MFIENTTHLGSISSTLASFVQNVGKKYPVVPIKRPGALFIVYIFDWALIGERRLMKVELISRYKFRCYKNIQLFFIGQFSKHGPVC